MSVKKYALAWALLWGCGGGQTWASSAVFTSREIFQVPFGPGREALGARIEDNQFSYPKDFTLDSSGRFYIYDSKKHRIARYSPKGVYEIGFSYPPTAQRVFAHADAHENLWLLVSDLERGLYYGVYDSRGKRLREGLFSQFNQFRLHLDDSYGLHVILSSSKSSRAGQTYLFDEASLLMKKENIAPPPQNHHQLLQNERLYYIDAVPNGDSGHSPAMNRITDASHRPVAQIKGDVIYMTASGDVYTRVGDCELYIYGVNGVLKGKATLPGLPSSCRAVRFDSNGDVYQLDGIPNPEGQYTPEMTGMRMMVWERQR